MKYEINPYVGVGPILFGMTRSEIRHALGKKYNTISKGSIIGHLSDVFRDIDTFVYYDNEDKCRAVEFGRPDGNPILLGCNLLKMNIGYVRDFIRKIDENIKMNNDGLTSFGLGVGIWHESGFDEPEEMPQSAIVFRRGYYEEPLE
ncbi:hypothetical protein FACS189485_12090 [Spirochaetia bacterium]|nr:hypothetical protein FACS189485_12090 [Spirochaetia bacterium]